MNQRILKERDSARDRAQRGRVAAFTLVEVAFTVGVLALLIAATMGSITLLNRWANSARLQTFAYALAQQKIDYLQTVPWTSYSTAPPVLQTGTTAENLTMSNDALDSAMSNTSSATALETGYPCTRTTVVSLKSSTTSSIKVTVSYTYWGKPYSCTLCTLRASDIY